MKLATTTIALLAIANGIQIEEDNIPQQLPEIELESEAETQPISKTMFEGYLAALKTGKGLPEQRIIDQMSQFQKGKLDLVAKRMKEKEG